MLQQLLGPGGRAYELHYSNQTMCTAILVEKSAGDSFPERLKPLVLIQTSGFFVSTGANHSEKGGA